MGIKHVIRKISKGYEEFKEKQSEIRREAYKDSGALIEKGNTVEDILADEKYQILEEVYGKLYDDYLAIAFSPQSPDMDKLNAIAKASVFKDVRDSLYNILNSAKAVKDNQ